jgi:tRNA-dihydrouridine synthase B
MTHLPAPFHIADIRISPPLTLAPMAGQTNHALRTIARELGGCGLTCTELLSSNAMHYGAKKTFQMFDWEADIRPVAVQLFGADPAMMAEAAKIVEDHGADIIDINMGCWVPKVAKQGAGAALLRDICTATAVVDAVIGAVKVPVTVKVRAGWDADTLTAVPFAKAAERSGVKAIAVHGRTAEQGFTGKANWDIIREVKQAVSIPVIGNGDVNTPQDAAAMFAHTGVDGIMIGRAALGNPWVFRDIWHFLQTGETLPAPTPAERAEMALRHAEISVRVSKFTEKQTVAELRGQLTKYHLGVPGAAKIRDGLVRAESLRDIETLLLPIAQGMRETA